MNTATYIEVSAEVRYWEDATINGIEDTNGTLTPFKRGELWCPVIRLADGQVMDWPAGTVANIHFKVCDQGEYWLLDESKQRVGKWGGYYVPDEFLCQGDTGFGDYIILQISAEGVIQKWTQTAVYNYVRPQNAHKNWPIKELFDRPSAAQRPVAKPHKWVGLTDEQRKAIAVCFTSGKVSVSEVQRKLAISYTNAQTLCQSIVDLGLADRLQIAPSLTRQAIEAKLREKNTGEMK